MNFAVILNSLPSLFGGGAWFEGQGVASLPEEIWLRVLLYVSASDLCRVARVCGFFRDLSADSSLWQARCLVELGFRTAPEMRSGLEWKEHFRCLHAIRSEVEGSPGVRVSVGCPHYNRSVMSKARCCGKWVPCRSCHNNAEDHFMNRFDVEEMLCVACKTVQPAAAVCLNGCHPATYYCAICKIWDRQTVGVNFYHCDACGICKRGKREDWIHCTGCLLDIHFTHARKHRCHPEQTNDPCPICRNPTPLRYSMGELIVLPCGHIVHQACQASLDRPICPLCQSSVASKRNLALPQHPQIPLA